MRYVSLKSLPFLNVLGTGLVVAIFTTGCSFEANIVEPPTLETPSVTIPLPDPKPLEQPPPDFIPGEIVTTSLGTPGFEVKAVFGEVSEKVKTNNGWTVDGVFYE